MMICLIEDNGAELYLNTDIIGRLYTVAGYTEIRLITGGTITVTDSAEDIAELTNSLKQTRRIRHARRIFSP